MTIPLIQLKGAGRGGMDDHLVEWHGYRRESAAGQSDLAIRTLHDALEHPGTKPHRHPKPWEASPELVDIRNRLSSLTLSLKARRERVVELELGLQLATLDRDSLEGVVADLERRVAAKEAEESGQ